jgi:dipeptide/tripeptide permease
MQLTHLQAMTLFALIISVVFAVMSRRERGARLRYFLGTFLAFMLIAMALGWLMYLFQR